jgi:hypothetical protein
VGCRDPDLDGLRRGRSGTGVLTKVIRGPNRPLLILIHTSTHGGLEESLVAPASDQWRQGLGRFFAPK